MLMTRRGPSLRCVTVCVCVWFFNFVVVCCLLSPVTVTANRMQQRRSYIHVDYIVEHRFATAHVVLTIVTLLRSRLCHPRIIVSSQQSAVSRAHSTRHLFEVPLYIHVPVWIQHLNSKLVCDFGGCCVVLLCLAESLQELIVFECLT